MLEGGHFFRILVGTSMLECKAAIYGFGVYSGGNRKFVSCQSKIILKYTQTKYDLHNDHIKVL